MSAKLIIVAVFAALLTPTVSFAQLQQLDTSARSAMYFRPIPRPVPPPPGDGWVWIPPTFRTVYDRVWSEPVYQTVRETAWVPEEYGWRTACYWEGGQYVQRQEWTITSPAHYETRTHQVQVSPGGWSYVPRREMITPGHWEWRGTTPPPPPQPWPVPTPTPPHTPTTRPPGLEPFSPLWDWPADSKK